MNPVLPRAIIFDWDNTLVDSWPTIIEAVNHTRTAFDLEPWSVAECKKNIARSARDSFPDWFGDRAEEAIKIFYEHFGLIQMENLTPMAGAGDLLDWLYVHAIPCVVVSNKNGNFLRNEAEALGWNRYFGSIIGATDAVRDKPAREHPDHALRLAGIEAGADIWFVGDSEADIACARNADCTPVFIGNSTVAAELGVDIYAKDCQELLGLLSEAHRAIA
jgi:phosphoglycolate phosphatase